MRLVDLARPELVDGLRNRRQLASRALAPVVLLVAIAALGLLTGEFLTPEPGRYRVAVAGDVANGAELLAALAATDMRIESVPDAALAVSGSADAALVLPPGADDALAAGRPLEVTLVSDATNLRSRTAAAEAHLALVALTSPLPEQVSIDRVLVDPTGGDAGGTSTALAQGAAALVLVQGGVLIGSAAARLTGRRNTGQLAPMLALPVARSRLVMARALTDTSLGLVAGAPLVALAVLAGISVRLLEGDPLGALWTAAVVVAAAAAVALPLVAVGLAIGARARSPQQVSLLTSLGLVVVAAAARWVALSPGLPTVWLAGVPLVGPAVAVRRAVTAGMDPLSVGFAGVATLAATYAATRVTARAFESEHLVLRGG